MQMKNHFQFLACLTSVAPYSYIAILGIYEMAMNEFTELLSLFFQFHQC